ATKNGAIAFGISGSGPTVFAFAKSKEDALNIKSALEDVYAGTGIQTQTNIDVLTENSGARAAVYND
ncbi:homoserine kinase, partial [Bacteroidota bacterium]